MVFVAVSFGAVGLASLFLVCTFLFAFIFPREALINVLGLQKSDLFHRPLQLILRMGVCATLVALMVCASISYSAVYFAMLIAPMIVWRKQAKKIIAGLFVEKSQINEFLKDD